MSRKFVRSTAAVATALAVGFGSMSAASAQDASGSLGGLFGGQGGQGSSIPGSSDLAQVSGTKQDLGDIGGPAWNVQLFATAPAEVAPGQTFTVQVEIQGNRGETRIDEIRQYMPVGFKLQKIERMKDGLTGTSAYTLKKGEYGERTVDEFNRVSVSWKDGLIIGQAPMVTTSNAVVVNFTWKAPSQEGSYSFKAGASVGALIGGSKDYTAPQKITVTKGAATGSLGGGSSEGSLSL